MVDAGAVAAQASGAGTDPQAGLKDFLQQLESSLQDDPTLDRDSRDALMRQLEDSMGDAGANAAPLATVADRAVWMDAMQALQASGAIDENDANDVIRQINQALQPLQRRESQLAIEFSRRLQTEGEEKALAWFRKEAAILADDAQTERSPLPPAEVAPLRSDVVNSRSRRLRGPPGSR
jgi:hypothetical protein